MKIVHKLKHVYKIRAADGTFYGGKSGNWKNDRGKVYHSRGPAVNAIHYHENEMKRKGVELVAFELSETEIAVESGATIIAEKAQRDKIDRVKRRKSWLERELKRLPQEKDRIDKELSKLEEEMKSLCES